MRIYLLNDTSEHHSGCKATMKALENLLSNHEIIIRHKCGDFNTYYEDNFNDIDAVVCNGEGTIHHNNQKARFLMQVLNYAQDLGKKTILLNAVYQDNIEAWTKLILNKLDFFSVRDMFSCKHSGTNPKVYGDLTLNYYRQHPKGKAIKIPYENFMIGDVHPDTPWHFLLNHFKAPHLGLNFPFEDMIATLKEKCGCYITGQFHGIIAAGLAGIKFIPIGSNSHKIEALISWSQLPINVCYKPSEVAQAIKHIEIQDEVFKDFQKYLLELPLLKQKELDDILC